MIRQMRFAALVPALMLALSLVGSCSRGAEGGTSGVDVSRVMGQLTAGEKGTFCDWVNGLHGGYGRSVACPDVAAETDADQADCVASFTGCAATVRQMEDCARRVGADVCNVDALESPECRAVSACF